MTPLEIFLTILLCLVLFAAISWFVGCIYLLRFAFLRRKKQGRSVRVFDPETEPGRTIREGVNYADATPREKVSITARDGIRLVGHLYDRADADTTIILFHGYRSFGENDFGCVLSYYYEERGMRVLLVDQRAHGESEGRYITFGILERYDCLAWAEYIAARFPGERIILDGLSMGSTTVMMASALPLPAEVKCVVADCGFTSPDAILRKVGRELHVPVSIFLGGVYFLCRTVAHFDPCAVTAPLALAKTQLPVLMIHGTGDDYVPCEMSYENAKAGGDRVRLLTVEGAGHGMSYLTDPETVKGALAAFLDEHV